MIVITSARVPAWCATLCAAIYAAVDDEGIMVVTAITFGGVNLDFFENSM